ncbi:MAG: serine/threonine-protein kinase [Planctomycetota bacterium]
MTGSDPEGTRPMGDPLDGPEETVAVPSSADRDPLVGGSLGGYRIEALLGAGAMGKVYRATHTAFGNTVALKTIKPEYADDPEYDRRFREELLAAGRLHEAPNVVRVLNADRESGYRYVTMDYVPGGSLGAWIRARGTGGEMTPAEALLVLDQAARGLLAAEEREIVHRDIKPDNLLIEANDAGELTGIKVADFGIAKVGRRLEAFPELEEGPSSLVGTPRYASPEQWRGGPQDHRTDMFSLGATIFFLMRGGINEGGTGLDRIRKRTLERPFLTLADEIETAFNPHAARDASPEAKARSARLVGLTHILEVMTAHNPEDRYRSFRELLEDLSLVRAGGAPRAPSPPEEVTRDPLLGARIGPYQIESLVGRGAMGRVYKATHVDLDVPRALKVLRRDAVGHDRRARKRFENEAQAAAKIQSPYVVRVFDVGYSDEGLPYLVMEYVDGGTLREYALRLGGRLPPDEAIRLMRQAAEGLLAAEEQRPRVVHRDIKPDNLLVKRDTNVRDRIEAVKVADFGVAKVEGVDLTMTANLMGTPRFASPEQWELLELDHRADMYSLGSSFFALLTGQEAAEGTTLAEVWTFVKEQPYLSPRNLDRDLPKGLDHVVRVMTAGDRRHRYASFADLIADLDRIAAGKGPKWPAPPKGPSPWPKRAAAATAAVLLLGAGVYFGVDGLQPKEGATAPPEDTEVGNATAPPTVPPRLRAAFGSPVPYRRLLETLDELGLDPAVDPDLHAEPRALRGDLQRFAAAADRVLRYVADGGEPAPDWAALEADRGVAEAAGATVADLATRAGQARAARATAEAKLEALRDRFADGAGANLAALLADVGEAADAAAAPAALRALEAEVGAAFEAREAQLGAMCREFRELGGALETARDDLRQRVRAARQWNEPALAAAVEQLGSDVEAALESLREADAVAAAREAALEVPFAGLDNYVAELRRVEAGPADASEDLRSWWGRAHVTDWEALVAAAAARLQAEWVGLAEVADAAERRQRIGVLQQGVARVNALSAACQVAAPGLPFEDELAQLAAAPDPEPPGDEAVTEATVTVEEPERPALPEPMREAGWTDALWELWLEKGYALPGPWTVEDLKVERRPRGEGLGAVMFGLPDGVDTVLIEPEDPSDPAVLMEVGQVTVKRLGRHVEGPKVKARSAAGSWRHDWISSRERRSEWQDGAVARRVHYSLAQDFALAERKRLPTEIQIRRAINVGLLGGDEQMFEWVRTETQPELIRVPALRANAGALDVGIEDWQHDDQRNAFRCVIELRKTRR